jgi:hypothetical protein
VKPVPCLGEVLQSQENQADFEAISARNRLSIAYFVLKAKPNQTQIGAFAKLVQ